MTAAVRLRPVIATLLLTGCGGGAATLHPAHTLPQNRVTFGAGVSSNFRFGSTERAVERGRSATAAGASVSDPEQDLVDGAVARAMSTEGVAPWVGARVGLPEHTEAGLTYTGRSARVDARHAFQNDSVALSVGAGASMILLRAGAQKPPAEPGEMDRGAGRVTTTVDDFDATGWGLDVPVIVGWRSTADVVQVWGGVRGGFEHAWGNFPIRFDPTRLGGEPGNESVAPMNADRWYAGGLVGFAIGLNPLWVAVQFDAAYQSITGTAEFPESSGPPAERSVDVTGLTVSPAGAIIGKF